MKWYFNHPPKGSCSGPGCPRFARCHCSDDCDGAPTVPDHSVYAEGLVGGVPRCFVRGHNPWTNRRHWADEWPDAKTTVVPLFNLLTRRFGTQAEVARQVGISRSAVCQWKKGRARRVDPEVLRRLEDLAVGKGGASVHEIVTAFRLLDLLARKHGTLSNAAEVYAERFGPNPDAVSRMFFRIKQGVTPVTEDFLDRLCTLVGTHLDAELAS